MILSLQARDEEGLYCTPGHVNREQQAVVIATNLLSAVSAALDCNVYVRLLEPSKTQLAALALKHDSADLMAACQVHHPKPRTFGLAPMKEQGQKACAVCESTTCVTVGGTEPCPVSTPPPL